MKASASLVVSKPIDELFGFVENVENMDRWVVGVSEPKWTSPKRSEVGATFASKYTYVGRTHDITYEVTQRESPRRLAVRSTSGPFPFEGVLELEETAEGTRVTNIIDAGADGTGTKIMFTLFGPLLRMGMRRQLRKELESLKTAVGG